MIANTPGHEWGPVFSLATGAANICMYCNAEYEDYKEARECYYSHSPLG